MKAVEIFIDEAGSFADRRMYVAGLAIISEDTEYRHAFHQRFSKSLSAACLTSGLDDSCSLRTRKPNAFLEKRPLNGTPKARTNYSTKVARAFELTEEATICNGLRENSIVGFSLSFSKGSARRWNALDNDANRFLDRPYSERIKDVLELMLWHVPVITAALTSFWSAPCQAK